MVRVARRSTVVRVTGRFEFTIGSGRTDLDLTNKLVGIVISAVDERQVRRDETSTCQVARI